MDPGDGSGIDLRCMMFIPENSAHASALLHSVPLIRLDSKNMDATIHAFKKCQYVYPFISLPLRGKLSRQWLWRQDAAGQSTYHIIALFIEFQYLVILF